MPTRLFTSLRALFFPRTRLGRVLVWGGLALAVFLLALGPITQWVVPRVVDINAIKTQIIDQLEEDTELDIDAHKIQVRATLWSGIGIHIKYVRAYEPQTNARAQMTWLHMYLRLWPLLTRGAREVDRLVLDRVGVHVPRESWSHKWKLPPKSDEPVLIWKDVDVAVRSYDIQAAPSWIHWANPVKDELGLHLRGKAINIRHILAPNRPMQASLDAQNLHPATLVFNGQSITLQPAAITARTNVMLADLEGKNGKPVPYHEVSQLRVLVRPYAPGTDKIKADGFRLELAGGAKVLVSNPARSTVNLRAYTRNVSLASLGKLIDEKRRDLRQLLSGLSGQIEALIHVEGPVAALRPEGWVKLKDATWALQRHKLDLQGLEGQVTIAPGLWQLKAFSGQLNRAKVDASLAYRPKNGRVTGRLSSPSLDVGAVWRLLAVVQTLAHQLVPQAVVPALPPVNISGSAAINLHVDGTTSQLANGQGLRGPVYLRNITLRDNAQGDLLVNNLLGGLVFDPAGFRLNRSLQGQVMGTDVVLTGQARHQRFDMTVRAPKVALSRLQEFITLPEGIFLAGTSTAEAQLSGPFKQPNARWAFAFGPDGKLVANLPSLSEPVTITDARGKGSLTDVFAMRQLAIESLTANASGAPVSLNGSLNYPARPAQRSGTLNLTASNIGLEKLEPLLGPELASRLPGTQRVELTGTGSANLKLGFSPGATEPNVNGTVTGTDVRLALVDRQGPQTIHIPDLRLTLSGVNNIALADTVLYYDTPGIGRQAFTLTSTSASQFRLAFDAMPMTRLKAIYHRNRPLIRQLAGQWTPELWHVDGSLAGHITAGTNGSLGVALNPSNLGAAWAGGPFPIHGVNGSVQAFVSKNGLEWLASPGLDFTLANEPYHLTGRYQPGSANTLALQGTISPMLANQVSDTLSAEGKSFDYVLPAFPFHVTVGAPAANRWDVTIANDDWLPEPMAIAINRHAASGALDVTIPATNVTLDHEVGRGDLTVAARLLGLGGKPGASNYHVQLASDGPLTFGRNAMDNEESERQQAVPSGLYSLFPTDGTLRLALEYTTMPDLFADALQRANKPATVTPIPVKDDEIPPQRLYGTLEADKLQMPSLDLDELTANLRFDGVSGEMDVTRIIGPGLDTSMRAQIPDLFIYPLRLSEASVDGQLFEVETVQAWLKTKLASAMDPVRQKDSPYLKAWREQHAEADAVQQSTSPVILINTPLAFDEAVFHDIIIRNVTGNVSYHGNGFLELNNLQGSIAGSEKTGSFGADITLNPADKNFMSIALRPDDVPASALALALLGVSGQITGGLSGTMQFTTYGSGEDEILANTNGTIHMVIEDGWLPAIAKIETLLTAANIIRGGIIGLNLNNFIRALQPFNTNYFAKLTGDFQIAEGTLYTDNLLSDGDDLDLLIEGTIQLADGSGDLTVTGTMSQDVSGRLGPLGKLSIGRLVRFIPGIGFIPVGGDSGPLGNRARGLIDIIPGLGFIPGFGGVAEAHNKFAVDITGKLDDPSAVHNLRWLD